MISAPGINHMGIPKKEVTEPHLEAKQSTIEKCGSFDIPTPWCASAVGGDPSGGGGCPRWDTPRWLVLPFVLKGERFPETGSMHLHVTQDSLRLLTCVVRANVKSSG